VSDPFKRRSARVAAKCVATRREYNQLVMSNEALAFVVTRGRVATMSPRSRREPRGGGIPNLSKPSSPATMMR
jgi:hypothetical protein